MKIRRCPINSCTFNQMLLIAVMGGPGIFASGERKWVNTRTPRKIRARAQRDSMAVQVVLRSGAKLRRAPHEKGRREVARNRRPQ